MTDSVLAQANRAFTERDNKTGLALLRQHCESNLHDAGSWHRLSVVEEQIGEPESAGRAHHACIQAAPANAVAYLYAGHWLLQQNKPESSAALYSLAQDLDPNILQLWRVKNQHNEETVLRARIADQHLRKVLSEHHRSHSSKSNRLRDAIWPRSHDAAFDYGSDLFRPDLFYIPSLSKRPYFEAANFEWHQDFIKRAPLISKELQLALRKAEIKDHIRPYLDAPIHGASELSSLAESLEWSAIDLFRDGIQRHQITQHFPNTLEALLKLPLYCEESDPFEIFFSVLKAGQEIAPHYGQSNHALTVHLAIDIPDHCHLSVAGEDRLWKENQLLIFDDSFLHSAHNNSQKDRVVLIFSVWHPDLSTEERHDVQSCFKQRRVWHKLRQDHVNALID